MNEIHIIAPFLEANGGDWRAIDLYLSLSKSNTVRLWAAQTPCRTLATHYPIQMVKPYQGLYPSKGELIVVGPATEIGHWYDHVKFSKVSLIYNLFNHTLFFNCMNKLTKSGQQIVHIQYISEMLKNSIGLPGDLITRELVAETFNTLSNINKSNTFTIGRVSRDVINKHHFNDPALYRSLEKEGIKVRILGGTCLEPWLGGISNIELLPNQSRDKVPEFLASLDCFIYRTSLSFREAWGGVVTEAMQMGLPVVCSRIGGYAESIRHGINGFLFDTNDEAALIIKQLRDKVINYDTDF